METVGSPAEAELHLLPDLRDRVGYDGLRRAGVSSIAVHAFLVAMLIVAPPQPHSPASPQPETIRRVTPLIEPPTVLTQKAPNPGKASKEFRASVPTRRVRVPAPPAPPPAPKQEPVRQAVIPAQPPPGAAPPTPMPEPPKTEAPKPESPQLPVPPPPQIQAEEKPAFPFERPGGPAPQVPPSQRQMPIPDPSLAIRGGTPGGSAGSMGANVGSVQTGQGGSVELPALLSDPQGIDFRPYLTRLLATVKRNWMTVWPESAKYGRRGRVGVQFSIAKDGTVTKVVWAFQSGADALDRAAVAAISMSNPFPPLPSEFKGDRIVLQFNFAYNMPKP
jgi:TonB family protein